MDDLDLVALVEFGLPPLVAAHDRAVEFDRQAPPGQAELGDQGLEGAALGELVILAVDPHVHRRRDSAAKNPLQLRNRLLSAHVSSSTPRARIDLSALEHNYAQVVGLAAGRSQVLAMVKANAYGHGAAQVTRTLSAAGCRVFGVATLDEAEALTDVAAGARIVVFGGLVPAEARRAARLGVEVVLWQRELAEALSSAASACGRQVAVHVKVDTGMHRLGVLPGEAAPFVASLEAFSGLQPVALCSHFAMAESVTTEVTQGQLERLSQAAEQVAGAIGRRLPCHLANSAAVLTRPEAKLDLVRPGLMLYGLLPDPALAGAADLRPVMTFEAPVVRVAELGPGEGIGYGHTFYTRRATSVATLRCGYADGYPRALSNLGEALIAGRRCSVIGRVCMDHTMLDVTGLSVALGDRAVLWGKGLDTGDVAARAGTIPYELFARVGERVQRIYEYEEEP